jgi:hypothetical protein
LSERGGYLEYDGTITIFNVKVSPFNEERALRFFMFNFVGGGGKHYSFYWQHFREIFTRSTLEYEDFIKKLNKHVEEYY